MSDRMTGAIYVYDRDGAYQRTFTLAEPRQGWHPWGSPSTPRATCT